MASAATTTGVAAGSGRRARKRGEQIAQRIQDVTKLLARLTKLSLRRTRIGNAKLDSPAGRLNELEIAFAAQLHMLS